MSSDAIKAAITSNSLNIKRNAKFISAIECFYKLNSDLRHIQPSFYKYISNESRFNIVLIACCFIFTHRLHSIKKIKQICHENSISSPNTIIAIISLLKVSGRLLTIRDDDDQRTIKLDITEKGMNDVILYVKSMITPLATLYSDYNFSFENIKSNSFLRDFFYGVSVPLFEGVTFKEINKKIDFYIDKDGGRSLLLYLYIISVRNNGIVNYTLNQLAAEFSVSRTQISKILKYLNENGNFKRYDRYIIEVTPAFHSLIEEYMSIYFSYIEYYIFSSADLRRSIISKK
ncbi:hypothetical protein AAFN90_06150 [Erwiniaceae bacterium CAU 1747]